MLRGKFYIVLFFVVLFQSNSFAQKKTCSLNAWGDTILCSGQQATIHADGTQYYSWSPKAGLSDTSISNPVASPSATTTYTCIGYSENGANLIVNGDFSGGNTGFTSDFTYNATDVSQPATYSVANNANSVYSFFSPCSDHTGGGKMLIVNGNNVNGAKVWNQTVTVSPNKKYLFTAYVETVFPMDPATLSITINNVALGADSTLPVAACSWKKFSYFWNSGSNTTAQISIVNKSALTDGDDFAIDDIKFVELCSDTDVVQVTVNQSEATATGTTNVCPGASINFYAQAVTGATYSWSGPNGFFSVLQNPSISNASATHNGWYILTVTVGPCVSKDSLLVNVSNLATPVPSVSTPVCQGSDLEFSLDYMPGATFSWTGPNGWTSSDQNPVIPDVTTANNGAYTVIATYEICASSQGTINVSVVAKPATPVASTTGNKCVGQNFNLSSTAVAGSTYHWSGPNGYTSTQQNNSITNATTAQSGIYNLWVTKNGCNSDTSTVTITINPNPVITASSNSPICKGQALQLTGTGLVSGTYSWSCNGTTITGATVQYSNLQTSGNAFVTATDANNCTTNATIPFVVKPQPSVSLGVDTTICEGYAIVYNFSSSQTYLWSDGGTDTTHSISAPGTYSVTATNSCGQAIDDKVVNVTPLPVVDLGPDREACKGIDVVLDAGNPGSEYLWMPSGDSVQTIHVSARNITIGVFVTQNNCTATDTIVISDCPSDIGLPNAFSPNGDGKNDVLYVRGTNIKEMKFYVFNRYGNKVFESTNPNEGWDGTFRGMLQESDVYVYYLYIKTPAGSEIEYQGNVTLVK